MKLINYEVNNGVTNMQIDSDILDNAIENSEKEPIMRLYGWSPMCISLGRNQKSELINNTNIDIVRRLTGGRALLHDDEITYSYVSPINAIPDGESVIKSYKYISGIWINFFKSLGIELDFGGNDHKPNQLKYKYCMLISTGADVCYQGKKIIGSAQYRKQGYILQHGSILFGYNSHLLENLFQEPVSTSQITTVYEILPNLSKEEFILNFEKFMNNY